MISTKQVMWLSWRQLTVNLLTNADFSSTAFVAMSGAFLSLSSTTSAVSLSNKVLQGLEENLIRQASGRDYTNTHGGKREHTDYENIIFDCQ